MARPNRGRGLIKKPSACGGVAGINRGRDRRKSRTAQAWPSRRGVVIKGGAWPSPEV